MTHADLISYEAKRRSQEAVKRAAAMAGETMCEAVPLEMPLHKRIMEHCDQQWPRWKYIRAASHRKSTIAEGCQDFTIFMPAGRTLCVECKARNEKPDKAQQAWHREMEMLGHNVHVVRNMDEFLRAVGIAQQ